MRSAIQKPHVCSLRCVSACSGLVMASSRPAGAHMWCSSPRSKNYWNNNNILCHTGQIRALRPLRYKNKLYASLMLAKSAAYRSISVRSTSTTLLNANHSGISSPARSISLNFVPESFFVVRFSFSATSAVT